jgi:hypothetical protein
VAVVRLAVHCAPLLDGLGNYVGTHGQIG